MLDVYATLFRIELIHKLHYRINMIFWLMMVSTESIVYLSVWQSAASAMGGTLNGLRSADFAAYYLTFMLVQIMTIAPAPTLLARHIQRGELSARLLKPIHPLHYYIVEIHAYKLPVLIMFIPCGLLIGAAFGVHLNPPLWSLLTFIPAVISAALLRFTLHYAMATAAFWTVRIDAVWRIHLTLQVLFGGILAPMSLLPAVLDQGSRVLPYRWIFAFPIDLALGRLNASEVMIAFAAQGVWIVVCILIMRVLWRAGLKRYGAVGG